MNVLDITAKIYAHLHNYKGVPYWALTPFRRMVRGVANRVLPCYLSKKHPHDGSIQKNLVVSFTSFPARIGNVWQVVECMLRQTYKPKKILLWLSKEQFKTESSIPQRLRDMQDSVFEIRMVDGDLRSHKKYAYAFKEFKNNLIVMVDDDIYYPSRLIERLMKGYEEHPGSVVGNYGFLIKYDKAGTIVSYNDFQRIESRATDSPDYFFGTGGGTLFPAWLLPDETCDTELSTHLAPFADDVWLNAMVRLAGLETYKIKSGLVDFPIYNMRTFSLSSINNGENKNDEQIKAVKDYYIKKKGIDPFIKRVQRKNQ